MRTTAIGVALVLVATASASAQGTQESPRTPLMLEVAARGYLTGGRMGSMAGDSAVDRLESYVWADQTLCGMGAGDHAPSNLPWVGWHFTGTVLVDAPGEMTVRIDWQRVWENGSRLTNGPGGTETYRIRSGERVELDRIVPTTAGSCGTIETKLEAAVMARAPYLVGVPGGVTGMRGMAAGARGGRGVGGRGGVAAGVSSGGAGANAGVASAGAGTGAGTGVAAGGVPAGVGATGARMGRGVGTGGGRGATAGAMAGTGTAGAGGGRGAIAGATTGTDVTGARMGRGVGTGGTRGAAAGAMAGTGVAGGRGRATAPDALTSALTMRRDAMQLRMGGVGAYDAEIWLVHKTPDGTEHVQQMSVRFTGAAREFSFPSVQVPSNGGPITLDITGSLQVLNGGAASGQYALRYSAEANRLRAARGASAARGSTESTATPAEASPTPLFVVSIARHARRATPFIDTRGTTDLSIQIPKPEDVFSFELPPLQKATEDLLKGHTFSVRLRMTPAK